MTAPPANRCTVRETGSMQSVDDSGKGIWLTKIISADVHGSSGFYPSTVLERDGGRAFPSGTHYYVDHSEPGREGEVRSLRDLAGVQVEDAYFADGPSGRGLYARVQLLPTYRELVEATAPAAGVSITASANREYDRARNTFVITELLEGLSIDFVARPGAGGRLVTMVESARTGNVEPPTGTPFVLAESDKQGLNKLYMAVESLTAQLTELQEKAATAKTKENDSEGEQDALSVDAIVAALDASELPPISRQRVAKSYAPGKDINQLINDEKQLVEELSAVFKSAEKAPEPQETETQQTNAGTTPAQESAAPRMGQVVTTENADGWGSMIDSLFGGA